MIGRTLGNYRIVEQIGMGGMATVFKAFDPDTDRYVALKILPEHYSKDPTFQERFRREAKAIARLEHIHILPVHAYGEQEGISYLVMRLLEAGTLSDHIKQGALPLDDASRLLSQIAAALDYAHSQGIIHRDIKPSNILLDRNNNAFLTDFGIAKMVESEALDLTGTGIIGTPQYMSPEQCRGDKNLTPASDIYSLGVVLYEMLTGRTPFQAETPLALIHMQLNEPLPPPRSVRPELTDAIEGVIFKALAKQPEQRYTTCTAMANSFAQAVAAFTQRRATDEQLHKVTITPSTEPTRAPTPTGSMDGATSVLPRGRRIPVWAIIGVVVIVLLIGAAMLVSFLSICCAPPPTSIAALDTPVAADTEAPTTTSATEAATQVAVAVSAEGLSVLQGHTNDVTDVAFSPDGTLLASASADGTTRLWDAATGAAIDTLSDGDEFVTQVEFSPDGTLLASGSDSGVRIWDVATHEQVNDFVYYVVVGVAFSPDGALLAVGGNDLNVIVWNVESGEQVRVLEGHTSAVQGVAFSPDGTILASSGGWEDGSILLWDVESGEMLRALDAGTDSVGGVAFSPDGSRVAAGASDGGVYIWDAATGEQVAAFSNYPYGVIFSPDGQILASGTDGGNIALRDAATGDMRAELEGHTDTTRVLAFSPDGTRLASGSEDFTIRLWDVSSYISQEIAAVQETPALSLEDLMAQGDAFAEEGDSEAAIDRFTQAIEEYPDSAWAYHNRGWVYYDEGNFDSAIADFEQTLSLDPDYPSAYLGLGYSFHEQGDFAEAVENFGALIERDPSAEAYVGRGSAYYESEQFEEAIADFTQALVLDEDYLDAYTGLGDSYYDTERQDEALTAYRAYLERAGDAPYDYVPPRVEELEAQLDNAEIAYVAGEELFYDDFEDGDADDWLLHRRARVMEDPTGNHVLAMLSLMGNDYVLARTGDVGWQNYALEFKVRVVDVAVASSRFVVGANVRGNVEREGCTRYFIGFEEWGSYMERLGEEDVCPLVTLTETPDVTITPQEWHTVRIEVYDSQVTVYMDNERVLSFADDEPLSEGYIGLETGRGTAAHFDEVRVVELVPAEGTETSGVTAVLTANANLRAGPGVDFALVRGAAQGEQLTVTARNARGTWLRVLTASGDTAWVLAERVEVDGSLADVPVMIR